MVLFAILSIVFVCLGIFAIVNPKATDVDEFLKQLLKKRSLKAMTKPKKNVTKLVNGIKKIHNMQTMVKKSYSIYGFLILSLALGVLGTVISIIIGNYFLMPILFVIFMVLPYVKLKFEYIKYNDIVLQELEPTLNAITSSFMRNDNIILSFEENMPYIDDIIKTAFLMFVDEVTKVNPNIDNALDNLKSKIDNKIFKEWCDALKRCNHDRRQKTTLTAIINKLSEFQIISSDAKNILYGALRTYVMMLGLNAILLIFVFLIFPTMLGVSLSSMVRNIMIAFNVLVSVLSIFKVYKETKTIDLDF